MILPNDVHSIRDLECPNCHYTGWLRFSHDLEIDTSVTSVECGFCGSKFPVPSTDLKDVMLEALRFGEEVSREKIVGSMHVEPIPEKWYVASIYPPMKKGKDFSIFVLGEIWYTNAKVFREVFMDHNHVWRMASSRVVVPVVRWKLLPDQIVGEA